MRAAGVLMASPTLFRAALRTADSALRHLPRFALYNKLNSWGAKRELPEPPPQSFREWYLEHRSGKGGRQS